MKKTVVHLSAFAALAAAFAAQAATDRNWTGGSGGTEAEPLEIYEASHWSHNALPSSSDHLVFSVDSPTVLRNSAGSGTTICDHFKPNVGDYTILGDMNIGVFGNRGAGTASVVKKGDWTIGWNVLLGWDGASTFAFTNATGKIIQSNNSEFEFGSAANSTVIVQKESGDWSVRGKTGDYGLVMGKGKGSVAKFYHLGGSLTAENGVSLGYGENSTALVEKGDGNWTVKNRFYMGKGKNSSSEFYNRGGTLEVRNYLCIGANGSSTSGHNYFEVSGGTVTQKDNNDVRIGDSGGVGVHNELCVKGGVFNARVDIRVGSGAPGILTVDGGEVNALGGRVLVACSGDAGEDASFALNGGVVRTKSVAHGNGNNINNATFTFNGGTLKAVESRTIIEASDKLTVTVGANGGTIDASGFGVTIAEDLSGTGGMRFMGGGTVTLAGANTYAGASTVELGTTLRVASSADLAGGLVVAVSETPPADAYYTVVSLTGNGTFDGFTLPAAPENSTLHFSDDMKSIVCVYGNPPNTWIGGTSGSLSDNALWSLGFVPTSGNASIFCGSSATLAKGDVFAPEAITFQAGSADVTIDGEGALTGIVAITNLSTSSHTINVPVYFAGDIQVVQEAMGGNGDLSKAHVTFAGGAHAAPGHAIENGDFSPVYSRCMFGHYYLYPTAESPWMALYQDKGNRPCLADNSSLTVPYAGSMHELYVGYGSVVTAGVSTVSNISGQQRFCTWNNGEIVVTNELFATNPGGSGKNDSFAFLNRSSGSSANVFKIEKATCLRNDGWTFWFGSGNNSASQGTYYFGSGGINFGSRRGYFGFGRDKDGDEQTVRPWYGDVTFNHGSGNDHDIWAWRNLVFNTDDASGIGRTITLDAVLKFARTPTFTVAGSGKVLVTRSSIAETQPSVTVTDTATLAFKPGTSLTTKTITVNDGATLAVAESGTNTVSSLSLVSGATLAFNFTDRRRAPVLAVSSITDTDPNGTIKIAVSGERPAGVLHVLTSGGQFSDEGEIEFAPGGQPEWAKAVRVENGDIVLEVKPRGMVMLIK